MTPRSPAILEQLIRDNELGWMIDMYSPPDRAIPFLIEQLTRLTAEFRNRFGYEVSFAPNNFAQRRRATRIKSGPSSRRWQRAAAWTCCSWFGGFCMVSASAK